LPLVTTSAVFSRPFLLVRLGSTDEIHKLLPKPGTRINLKVFRPSVYPGQKGSLHDLSLVTAEPPSH